jgi:TatD-related deoxyribonuclease
MAKEIMIDAMEMAAQWVEEGKAIAIGEVGRPHFEVSEEVWQASNEILVHGMELANEKGCAIVLHTERSSPEGWKELASFADRAGIERGRVVKHFSPPEILPDENQGLFPSVLASKDNIRKALQKGNRFTMETDFIDDPRRPGAVLSLRTVPKRTKAFLENGIMSEEDALKIHKENPERVYGVEIE